MDPINAASKLRRLLIIHDTILKQLREQESNIENISRCLFADGLKNNSRDMSVYHLRLSVATGVKNMLEICRSQLIHKVRKLSCQIIAAIQADDTSSVPQTELEHSNPPVNTDSAAIQYTSSMTLSFRTE